MTTPTYKPLATFTASGGESSVTFSGIPSSFRDLVVTFDAHPTAGDSSINVAFNDDTSTSNYPAVYMYGTGSSYGAGTLVSNGIQTAYMANGGKSHISLQILDYSATDKHTVTLARQSDIDGWVALWTGRWANTAAVNKINVSFAQAGRTWNAGSTINLFGIEG
jgi:hypothetical protein